MILSGIKLVRNIVLDKGLVSDKLDAIQLQNCPFWFPPVIVNLIISRRVSVPCFVTSVKE